MRYAFLIYTEEQARDSTPPEQQARISAGHWAVVDEASRRGIYRGAEPLEPTETATTVRLKDGKPQITDGPFAEAREQLAGYYILDCKDLDEGLEWAVKISTAYGGTASVEVRPVREMPRHAKME